MHTENGLTDSIPRHENEEFPGEPDDIFQKYQGPDLTMDFAPARQSPTTPRERFAGPMAMVSPEGPLPIGSRVLPETGEPIPEALQYDHRFLSLPRVAQALILQNVAEGLFVVAETPVVQRTSKHTVRLREGQWSRLEEIILTAAPHPSDQRRNLTENSLLREILEFFFCEIAPHLDLRSVHAEGPLQMEVMKAYRRSLSGIIP